MHFQVEEKKVKPKEREKEKEKQKEKEKPKEKEKETEKKEEKTSSRKEKEREPRKRKPGTSDDDEVRDFFWVEKSYFAKKTFSMRKLSFFTNSVMIPTYSFLFKSTFRLLLLFLNLVISYSIIS